MRIVDLLLGGVNDAPDLGVIDAGYTVRPVVVHVVAPSPAVLEYVEIGMREAPSASGMEADVSC